VSCAKNDEILPMGNLNTHIDGNTPADQTRIIAAGADVPATQVTMVYKNHLDIGFTESVSKVTHDAIHWMLSEAISLDRRCRAQGLRFVWTTPAWVLWEACEINDAAGRSILDQAIADGSLAWHALPFTSHTELLDEQMLDVACSLGNRGNRGRYPINRFERKASRRTPE
jgi:hypothetical protein